MNPEPCKGYQTLIDQYACGMLDEQHLKRLNDHARRCPACRRSLDALDRADRTLTDWTRSMDPVLLAGQSQTLNRFREQPDRPVAAAPRLPWMKYAAAACVLLAAGFLAGRAQRPTIDMDALTDQLAASLQPQIQQRVTASVADALRPQIATEYAQMQEALADQLTVQLAAYAEQTVLRNDIQTYDLLGRLIEAIQTAQSQNQQWALSAMQELQAQRLMDQQQVRKELAAFAVYTDTELLRTREQLENLTKDY